MTITGPAWLTIPYALLATIGLCVFPLWAAGAARRTFGLGNTLMGREGAKAMVTAWAYIAAWPIEDLIAKRRISYNLLFQDMANALRTISPKHETGRIWGRWHQSTPEQGQAGNIWAADPEDLAEILLHVVKAHLS